MSLTDAQELQKYLVNLLFVENVVLLSCMKQIANVRPQFILKLLIGIQMEL